MPNYNFCHHQNFRLAMSFFEILSSLFTDSYHARWKLLQLYAQCGFSTRIMSLILFVDPTWFMRFKRSIVLVNLVDEAHKVHEFHEVVRSVRSMWSLWSMMVGYDELFLPKSSGFRSLHCAVCIHMYGNF